MGTRPFQAIGAIDAVRALFSALLLLACAALSTPALAQASNSSDTDDTQARAVVVTRNSFFLVQDLNFGDILAGNTAVSLVRLQPNGTRTLASGNAVLINNNHQPSRFAGRGRQGQLITIRVTQTPIFLTGPGVQMRVDQFEIGSSPTTVILTTSPQSFTIGSASGAFNFAVGGRLRVNANQAPGVYTGQFTVELDYQ
jgi:spore coat protein U-like protein